MGNDLNRCEYNTMLAAYLNKNKYIIIEPDGKKS